MDTRATPCGESGAYFSQKEGGIFPAARQAFTVSNKIAFSPSVRGAYFFAVLILSSICARVLMPERMARVPSRFAANRSHQEATVLSDSASWRIFSAAAGNWAMPPPLRASMMLIP